MDRYAAKKAKWTAYMGGCCVDCGATEDLEFDHINPETKAFNILQGWGFAEERLIEELKKCQLLCSICHDIKTATDNSVPHGGGKSGKRNCKCVDCKLRKNEYMRNWKRERKASLSS